MKVLQNAKENCPPKMELLRRWRVIAKAGETLLADELTCLDKADQERTMKAWSFLVEHVVADTNATQDSGKT